VVDHFLPMRAAVGILAPKDSPTPTPSASLGFPGTTTGRNGRPKRGGL